ncbi:universal stress protein [Dyella choica]|uniref:Universal stress protein n=1 Tax=Dyella choica TaxID=1927959 RepID=A0A432MB39_9GAMM|nr:universal stress protein [Dyella choica]RUL78972.1 universal stress protein [Dyella choica]
MNIEASRRASADVSRQPAHAPSNFHDVLALGTSVAPWSPALLAAVDIAALWNSNVTGCYVPGCLREQRALEDDPTVLSLLADIGQEWIDDTEAFQTYAKDHGARHAAWMVTRTAIAPTLRKLGAWHDLAVLERDMVDETRLFDILGEAMLCSRVPCLVLPQGWNKTLPFKRIVVAWNGSFESTRALHSALPLLQLAREVSLINGHISDPDPNRLSVAEPDPMIYIMHHAVAAKPHYLNVSADEAGKALLDRTQHEHADLLVMGGYGHSRIRERILGGATRHVMAHAGIPVFMQH